MKRPDFVQALSHRAQKLTDANRWVIYGVDWTENLKHGDARGAISLRSDQLKQLVEWYLAEVEAK